MTLLDVAMAHAARTPRKPEDGPDPRGVVTIEMKTTFMRPAAGRVALRGQAAAPQRRDWPSARPRCSTTPASVWRHATGTFKYLARPAGGRPATPTSRNAIATD